MVSVRAALAEAVERGDLDRIEEVIAGNRRGLRHLVSFLYRADGELRAVARKGLVRAARHHPKQVQEVLRRLVWAMNEESGTNAVVAPAVMREFAQSAPRLLLPLIPDLLRLTSDEGLHDEIVEAVRAVAEQLPGEVSPVLNRGIRECLDGVGRKDGRRV